MQPEEWTPPKKQEAQPAPELGEEMPMGPGDSRGQGEKAALGGFCCP